jgi:tetratricopeptide (TPR) repeat protein
LTAVVAGLVVAAGVAGWWLTTRDRPADQPRTPNPDAVRAARKAYFGGNAGRAQVMSGIHYYEEAVRIDPSFATAWSGLASAHIALTWFGEDRAEETMAKAKHEAQEALKLDASMGSAWRALAAASHFYDFDQQEAERRYLRAIELGPTDAVTRSWYGDYLFDLRRYDEALIAYKKAEDANPRWLEPITFAGNVHAAKGNYDLALVEYRRALAIEPTYALGNHFMGRALLAQKQHAAAIAQLRKSNELLGHVPFSMADLGYALAVSGQRAEAEQMRADLMSRREKGYYPAFAIAEVELGLGRADEALTWLERALNERNIGYNFPSADPVFQSLWETPRFRKLIDRLIK